MYGDITNRPEYKSHMMRLQATESYTVNSKGESVPIHEVAWGNENDVPTHMLSLIHICFFIENEWLFRLDIFIFLLKEVINDSGETFIAKKVFTFVNS